MSTREGQPPAPEALARKVWDGLEAGRLSQGIAGQRAIRKGHDALDSLLALVAATESDVRTYARLARANSARADAAERDAATLREVLAAAGIAFGEILAEITAYATGGQGPILALEGIEEIAVALCAALAAATPADDPARVCHSAGYGSRLTPCERPNCGWPTTACAEITSAPAGERITHGRHCTCGACEREDWTQPHLAPCGMHGSSCPRAYQPWGPPGSYHRADEPAGDA